MALQYGAADASRRTARSSLPIESARSFSTRCLSLRARTHTKAAIPGPARVSLSGTSWRTRRALPTMHAWHASVAEIDATITVSRTASALEIFIERLFVLPSLTLPPSCTVRRAPPRSRSSCIEILASPCRPCCLDRTAKRAAINWRVAPRSGSPASRG
jgi:hypothetical protein